MKDKQQKKMVAVFMPTANYKKWLPVAIKSILNQTYSHIDLYVVDDDSEDVNAQLAGDYPNVTFMRTSKSVGPYVINNMLLKLTSSEFVAFQDSDDTSHPKRFEFQISYIDNLKLDGCGTYALDIDLSGEPIGFEIFPPIVNLSILENNLFPVLHPTTLYRRYVLDTLGGFDNSTRIAADTEFLFRCFLSFKMGNVQQFLYKHLIHPDSLTQALETGFFSEDRNNYKIHILSNMKSILAGSKQIPPPGYLMNSLSAGLNEMPDYELIQLGCNNKTWRSS